MAFNINVSFSGKAAKLAAKTADAVIKYGEFAKEQKRAFNDYIDNIKKHDPAATNTAEIVLLYSGVHAVAAHRVANKLYKNGYRFAARAISQMAKFITGIEIHPGATIGKCLFIDHGTGVVIGETAEIGDYCTIYQGATLGGTGKDTGKRHPTLGNKVMVGAGAKVLGPFKVGDGAKIAAGAVVLSPVPDNTTAVGIPAKAVNKDKDNKNDMDHIHIPDPVAQMIKSLEDRLSQLEGELFKGGK